MGLARDSICERKLLNRRDVIFGSNEPHRAATGRERLFRILKIGAFNHLRRRDRLLYANALQNGREDKSFQLAIAPHRLPRRSLLSR